MNSPGEDIEFDRMVAEEDLILAATEAVAEAMERSDINRKGLAERLGVTPGEITQRMSGTRNLTLRSLAAMLHTLGATAELHVRYVDHMADVQPLSETIRFSIPLRGLAVPNAPVRQPFISVGGPWRSFDSGPLVANAS